MSHLRTLSLRARDSFWFWPTVLGIAAIVLAQVLVSVDRGLLGAGVRIGFLDALSASGGRSILTTVGTSMLTVAGTSFSIVISVLATTTSTYGPRLVRNFMADRGNQLVLAAFTSTFLYTIVVLRSVHTDVDDSSAFVPVIAVHVAVLGGILDVGVLVFFIHHVAKSVEVTTLQQRVQRDLRAALDAAFVGEAHRDRAVRTDPVDVPQTTTQVIRADRDGYVQSVAWERLRRLADGSGGALRVVAMPGTHVIEQDVLADWVRTPSDADRPDDAVVAAQFMLGAERTPYQDVGFALQQLVEIAVRGLASGSNDPYTTVSALDMAAVALVPVWREQDAVTALVDDSGEPLVLCDWPSPAALVDDVFASVLIYGGEHPIVLRAARRLGDRLEAHARPDRRGALDHRLRAVDDRLAAVGDA